MTTTIDLNCDMGEWFALQGNGANFSNTSDDGLLEVVTSANIACGFHAGDPSAMRRTVEAALAKGVTIGAHPSLPDVAGFGRREMKLSMQEIFDLVVYQIGALEAIARAAGAVVRHVKPHGALYNMAARDAALSDAIARAIQAVNPALYLVGLAQSELTHAGENVGLATLHEGFCDRTYQADGSLTPRLQSNAVHQSAAEAASQAVIMATQGVVKSVSGELVPVKVHTLCIHGDTPNALGLARAVRSALEAAGVVVQVLSFMLCMVGVLATQCPSMLYSQTASREKMSVSGTVVSADDKSPIAGARVFIANTTIGVVSTTNGSFRLVGVPLGKSDVIISAMGYELVSKPLIIDSSTQQLLSITLKPKPVRMRSVRVMASRKPADTSAYIRQIVTLLIGQTENAQQTALTNPQALRVSIDEDDKGREIVTAESAEPLLIENKALGYKLTYHLTDCGISPHRSWYMGYVMFEERVPSSSLEESRWKEQRKRVYYGSRQHFLRALATDSLLQQGFAVRRVVDVDNYLRKAGDFEAVQASDIAAPANKPATMVFAGEPALEVVYERGQIEFWMRSYLYHTVFERSGRPVSLLQPKKSILLFNSLGYFEEPREVLLAGYYGLQRLADELPATYYPPE